MAVVLITLLNPVTQIQKANDARRKSDLTQLQKTLEAYYSDNGYYPTMSTGATYKISPGGTDVAWGGTWGAYNTTVPADPSTSRNYVYYRSTTDSQTYYLYASLERGSQDPQACSSLFGDECLKIWQLSITPYSCGSSPGQPCNYGVSSSNTSP